MEIAARIALSPARPTAPVRRGARADAAPAYRRPIDGLRAVAVGAIVLFHFGVRPFGGGFVGVDVFFVISGFLITRMLLGEGAGARPSLAEFYKRRILRLYPALFLMLLASLGAALLLLYPTDLRRFGESLASVAGLGSNVYFRNSFGYFNAAANQKPLLHTWSLSVEEQFYLVYPVVLAALARRSRRTAAAGLCLVALASLAAGAWAVRAAPMTAFYLMPCRFWELMLGGLIPLFGLAAPRSRLASEALAWGGLGLIGASVFGYTVDTPFPGLLALPPCLGAAAAVLSCDRAGANGAARLLSSAPAAALGRVSYSLYLWHWPVIVFAGQWLFRPATGPEIAALLALSLALAAASHRFVEQPFRRGAGARRARPVLAAGAGAMAAAALCGGALVASRGLPQRFPPEVRAILDASAAAARDVPREHGCLGAIGPTAAGGETCRIGASATAEADFVLWGDSLAGNLIPPVAEAAVRGGRSGVYAAFHACTPLDGVDALRVAGCRAFNADTERRILADRGIRTVILASFWAAAVSPLRPDPGRSAVLLRDGASADEGQRAFDRGIDRLVAALTAAGKRVVIVASVPEVGVDVPESLARLAQGRGRDPAPTLAAYLDRQSASFAAFTALSTRYGVEIVHPHEALCDGERCTVGEGGLPLYFDAAHLNARGASKLRPLFADLF